MANEANEQLAASKEQLATLKKQLEEAKKLRDQAEKARVQAEEEKAKAEKERDEAEQHSYDVGVAETEDALRVEVPAVCRVYCTQTWEEAFNRAGIDASSELRKLENIIFPFGPTNSQSERGSSSSFPTSRRGPASASSLISRSKAENKRLRKAPLRIK